MRRMRWTNESLLVLRQMVLFAVSVLVGKTIPMFLLEHPARPDKHSKVQGQEKAPSFWRTEVCKEFAEWGKMKKATFNQKLLGHAVDKMTTVMNNIPGIDPVDGLGVESGPGKSERSGQKYDSK